MPLVNGPLGSPYPLVNDVMNTARSRVNDMMNDATGDLLTNDAPYAQTYLSDAWEWYQEQCAGIGVETLKSEIVLFSIPARASDDVAFQSWITWQGASDGVNQYEAPVLPQDLIQPLSTWRRPSQATNTNQFQLMTLAEDGLPRFLQPNVVDWREDGMYFYGDTQPQDILIRYDAYRADLDITKPDSEVPMMRCRNVLGTRVAYEFASARGSAQAPAMEALADKFFQDGPAKRSSRRKQRGTVRRIPYGGRGSVTGQYYPFIR